MDNDGGPKSLSRLFICLLALVSLCTKNDVCAEPIVLAAVEGSDDVNVGVAVVREAYRRAGIELEIRWLGGAEALELSNSGKIDGEVQRIDGINRTFENLVQIQVPVNFLQGVAFARTDTFTAFRWHNLRPYRIGIVGGILFAEEGTRGMNPRRFATYAGLIGGLARAEIDVAVMPRISGLVAIAKQGAEGIVELDGVLEQMFLYHYLHKENEALIPVISRHLRSMLEDLTTQRMRQHIYENTLGSAGDG